MGIKPFYYYYDEKNFIFSSEIKPITQYLNSTLVDEDYLSDYLNTGLYDCDKRTFFKNINKLEDFPMLPVRIFKKFDLKSVSEDKIVKKLVSSGTSGRELSKIYLDKKNANNQVRVLGKIMSTILGNKRLPMLIIDQSPKILDRSIFNARSTAIYGFSIFGINHCFLLDKENKIDYISLNNFFSN